MTNNKLPFEVDKLFSELKSSVSGLSEKEVLHRINKYGKNILPSKKKGRGILLFLEQFNSGLVYILIIAALISWKFEHYIDAWVILAIVIINAVIGFFQRWHAERVLDALKKMMTKSTRVVRSGVEKRVLVEDIVLGDIVILEAGDSVPADMVLIEGENVKLQEASLTGESVPVEKFFNASRSDLSKNPDKNKLFMGTSLVSGYCKSIVVETAENTRLGRIAKEIKEIKSKKTHFEKKSDELALQMGAIALFGAILTFVIGYLLRGMEFFDIFLFSVAALVAGIPTGLPAVLTIVLAIGASAMAKKNVIVKHLPSVETLGVTNVICTDKTGTLTKNTLTAKKVFVGNNLFYITGAGDSLVGDFILRDEKIKAKDDLDLLELINASLITSGASLSFDDSGIKKLGEPVELAFEILARKANIYKKELFLNLKIIDKIAFSSKYKYKANLVEFDNSGNKKRMYVSGAFEVLLNRSDFIYLNGKIEELTKERKKKVLDEAVKMASEAMKVTGCAFLDFSSDKDSISKEDVFGLVFVGIFGMIDPPKKNVKESIKKCREAGVDVLMLTGDYKITALAVAKDINLISSNEGTNKNLVMTEDDLSSLTDDEFRASVLTTKIFARVTPETKLKIASFLQKEGKVVAMTGDGVNDAPALKQADVGVSMGLVGTDVAKEASAIILTDDNFSSMVDAILEGRIVFSNVKKTSFYLITTNVAEAITIVTALSFGMALPLLAIQLLWLNLVTDGITVIALASEPRHDGVLKRKPVSKDAKILSLDVLPLLFFTAILMVFGTLSLFLYFLPEGIDKARTVAFTFMAFSQFFNVINMRSLSDSILKIGFFSNKFMVWALILSVAVQLFVIYNPFFQEVFSFESLSFSEWILIIISSSLILFVVEIYKFFKRR